LPLTIAGLAPDRDELQAWGTALADYADGANIMAGTSAKIVEIAETTHDAAERALQIGGAISIVGAGAELLAEEGCEAFAG
jgi:hypothetical protein